MRRPALFVVVVGVGLMVSSCQRDPPGRGADNARNPVHGPTADDAALPVATAAPLPTRPVRTEVSWVASAGAAAEAYSEGRFAPLDLRFGERFSVQRVCVSDARKITMISYTDTVGHTDVPLMLGNRGPGRLDANDSRCTVFDGVEVARLEKCKCWFQCAGERHTCSVSGVARRE